MQFVFPYFLFGLFAILIPIIIHLFQFHRYRKIYFSNVEALQTLEMQHKKQAQLHHWLVLLARILAIVFLVLAFAQPYIPNPKQSTINGQTNRVCFYLDNSFSMENSSSDGSLFELAKQQLVEISKTFSPTDLFLLITNDFVGGEEHWISRDALFLLIGETQISPTSRKLSDVVLHHQDLVRGEIGNRFLFLISDFQRSISDIESFKIDTSIHTFMVPIKADHNDNIYIENLSFSAPIFQEDHDVEATVTIVNSSNHEIEMLPVKLIVEGKQRALASVSIPPQTSENVSLKFKMNQKGWLSGHVAITDYPITFDDEFYFALSVGKPIKILVIEGKGSNKYFNRLWGKDIHTDFEIASEKAIPYQELSSFDFIILDQLSTLSQGLMDALSPLLDKGGHLLIIPGTDAHQDGYNPYLSAWHLPTFGQPFSENTVVSEINPQHSLYKGVFEAIPEQMELPVIKHGFRIESATNTVKESILRLSSGSDFLTQSKYRNGSVYLLGSIIDDSCNNFAQQALFVPTFYNMGLLSQALPQPFYFIGDQKSIELNAPSTIVLSKQVVKMKQQNAPDFSVIPQQHIQASKLFLNPKGAIKKAENYDIICDNTLLGVAGMNYNRQESALTFYSAKELKHEIKKLNQESSIHILSGGNIPIQKQIQQFSENTSYTIWMILMALSFVLCEILLLQQKKKKEPKSVC